MVGFIGAKLEAPINENKHGRLSKDSRPCLFSSIQVDNLLNLVEADF